MGNTIISFLSVVLLGFSAACTTGDATSPLPVAVATPVPVSKDVPKGEHTAVFAGGCFWGVEAVFESLKGVREARSGYAGGDAKQANYDAVSSGETEHAEAVLVAFDPDKITYAQLLKVFFTVAHDPTEMNRQGPDVGPQYRSAIFYTGEEQQKQAAAFIADLDKSGVWPKPIVTEVVPLEKFYVAEAYHQNYLVRNPTQPYIVHHDMPKLEELKKKFPELYQR